MQIDFAGLKHIIRNNDAPGIPKLGTYKPACVFLLLFNLRLDSIFDTGMGRQTISAMCDSVSDG